MNDFQKKYQQKAAPKIMDEFGYKNRLATPKVEKISLNVGLSRAEKDQNFIKNVTADLKAITGQMPVTTCARKAISGFKIRQGQKIGLRITLRGKRMWDFLYRFVAVALPRTKDFQGIEQKNFDQQGNLSLGIKEQLIFPEIFSDETDTIFSLQVNIKTSAKNKKEGIRVLKLMGFPIQQEEE